MTSRGQRRLPIVGVMGSGASADAPRCTELGRWLGGEGVHLLTGGGRGVMAAVSRGFIEAPSRIGLVLAVLPASAEGSAEPPEGYPNPWVEVVIRTHLHKSGAEGTDTASRNHINVLSSDVVIALGGSRGTRSEVDLALRYGRPLVAYVQDRSEIPELPEIVPSVRDLRDLQGFVRAALGRAP